MSEIKKNPIVSIIAICHKHAPFVIDTLDSIRNQTYSNIELIIINNVKDECEAIIKGWIQDHQVKCIFIQNVQSKTITQNCNIGLANCNGEYFQIVSCDDILLPQKIRKQIDVFVTLDEKYACIYSDMLYIDKDGNRIDKPSFLSALKQDYSDSNYEKFDYKQLFSARNPIPPPTVLLRMSAVQLLNGYDESIDIEDYSMNLELFSKGYRFYFLDIIAVLYRILDNSLSMVFRKKKYDQIVSLLIKYKEVLDVKNRGYRFKLFRGILFSANSILNLHSQYKQYILITKDISPVTYFKLLYHYNRKTVHKKVMKRI